MPPILGGNFIYKICYNIFNHINNIFKWCEENFISGGGFNVYEIKKKK